MSQSIDELLTLEPHGPDTFVGQAGQYPFGRLFGGQVIAQALRAASATVPDDRPVHSLHAYFILGGRPDEPVRYEVERLRNGKSFITRNVVARQSYGAILSLSCSFQTPEDEVQVQNVAMPTNVPPPDELPEEGWGWGLHRRQVPIALGSGAARAWVQVDADLGDDLVLQACGLAFASDTGTVAAVRATHPAATGDFRESRDQFMGASLDHAVWFHRPARADDWLLIDMACHDLGGGRGLTFGHVFDRAGRHVASIAQEALLRERRASPTARGDVSGT
jgi:acyl-CoA thioesterase-2